MARTRSDRTRVTYLNIEGEIRWAYTKVAACRPDLPYAVMEGNWLVIVRESDEIHFPPHRILCIQHYWGKEDADEQA